MIKEEMKMQKLFLHSSLKKQNFSWQQWSQFMVSKKSIYIVRGMVGTLCYLDQMKVTKKTRKAENVESVNMITGYDSVLP